MSNIEVFINAFNVAEGRGFKYDNRIINGFCEMMQLYLNNYSTGIPISKSVKDIIESEFLSKYKPIPLEPYFDKKHNAQDFNPNDQIGNSALKYWFFRGEWKERTAIAKTIINEYAINDI